MQWLQRIVLARNCKISLSRQCWCFQQMLYSCHDEAINTDQTNLCVRWDHCFRWTESSMSCKSTFIGSDYLFLSILRRYCLNVWKQILSNWNILFPWNMLCLSHDLCKSFLFKWKHCVCKRLKNLRFILPPQYAFNTSNDRINGIQ